MWEVRVSIIEEWIEGLDPKTYFNVMAAIGALERVGPALGRPLVDRIKGSRHHNMKELRPASAGRTEIRILFIFDPVREGILLVAGDKSTDWQGWYSRMIPLADARYDQHLESMRRGEST